MLAAPHLLDDLQLTRNYPSHRSSIPNGGLVNGDISFQAATDVHNISPCSVC